MRMRVSFTAAMLVLEADPSELTASGIGSEKRRLIRCVVLNLDKVGVIRDLPLLVIYIYVRS